MAPPNACRGMPNRLRSRSRSEVSQAPVCSAARSSRGGSLDSRALPRPSSGSRPALIAAHRSLISRARSTADLRSAASDLDAGQLLATAGGHDEEHVYRVPVVLPAAGDPDLEFRHLGQPVRDRPADEMGDGDMHPGGGPGVIDVAQQGGRVQLQVTKNCGSMGGPQAAPASFRQPRTRRPVPRPFCFMPPVGARQARPGRAVRPWSGRWTARPAGRGLARGPPGAGWWRAASDPSRTAASGSR